MNQIYQLTKIMRMKNKIQNISEEIIYMKKEAITEGIIVSLYFFVWVMGTIAFTVFAHIPALNSALLMAFIEVITIVATSSVL